MTQKALLFALALALAAVGALQPGPAAPTHAQTTDTPALTLSHRDDVIGVEWSPDGAQMLTWTPTTVNIWDTTTGERQTQLQTEPGETFILVEWRPVAERVLAVVEPQLDSGIFDTRIYDTRTGVLAEQLSVGTYLDWDHAGRVVLMLRPDNTTTALAIAPTGEDYTIATTGRVARLSPDGRYGLVNNTLHDANTGIQLTLAAPDAVLDAQITSADWSPDSQTLLLGTVNGDVVTFALPDATPQTVIATGPTGIETFSAQFVNDAQLIFRQSTPTYYEIFSRDGELLQTIDLDGPAINIDWQGSRVAIAHQTTNPDENRLLIVDALTGPRANYTYPAAFIGASWSPEGEFLLARFFDNTVVLFNPETGAGVYANQFDTLPGIVWHPTDLQYAARLGDRVEIYDLTPFAVEFE